MTDELIWLRKRHSGTGEGAVWATATLIYDLRQRSRLRVTLDNGQDAAIDLPRGSTLRSEDLLEAADGRVVSIVAAPEQLSVVRSEDVLQIQRAAYHLGNRHVALQIRRGEVSYMHDHVLDHMIVQLGLQVSVQQLPFEPEPGAYGDGKHAHVHGHGHGHGHGHEH